MGKFVISVKGELPDFHVILLDYLEELGNGELALEVMPKISYQLNELYPYIVAVKDYEEFVEKVEPMLSKLLLIFAGELSKEIGIPMTRVYEEVLLRILDEVKRYYEERRYRISWRERERLKELVH